MDIVPFMILSLIVPIIAILVIISLKIIRGRALPSNDYTPFDYITGQSSVEFHEEKQEKEEEDDEGDDKDKNTLYPRI
ncbi:DUF3951 domain-containing protein [Paenibacillus sp. ACRRX]|uniref:DUF3951 domain-containing protein n=1 Tax=Paenibacillus sp. ACRRX TaxID=2918206 RepID=UPI001EF5C1CC|nr:DUF3951 domain-containing protein [Paenibacillus sp. ACRRX]MCG7407304.1 DUF3951 domain-containing protein [Paenibacillus sp. ACRRX]